MTAGAEVAFAHALLRCGTPEELDGQSRESAPARPSVYGETDERWVVTHEHHSFPDQS